MQEKLTQQKSRENNKQFKHDYVSFRRNSTRTHNNSKIILVKRFNQQNHENPSHEHLHKHPHTHGYKGKNARSQLSESGQAEKKKKKQKSIDLLKKKKTLASGIRASEIILNVNKE